MPVQIPTTLHMLPLARRSWAAAEGHIPGEDHPGLRFVFDSDRLAGDETPEALDLDGGEIIEVHF